MPTKSRAPKPSKKAAKKSARKPSKKAGPASPKKTAASAARPASFNSSTSRNGLRSFAFHRQDRGAGPVVSAIRPALGADELGAEGAAPVRLASLDAEAAARHYLSNALASEHLPEFTAAEVSGAGGEFKLITTEAVPLTGTKTVKFAQHYRNTPVYGALVTVELDKRNELVSLNSALSEPTNVDPVASVSPAEALRRVRERAGYAANQHLDATPRLYYYFDRPAQRWRLVYITRDV
ncbi:MAG: hypothetical protein M3416_13010, partial [Acidobacteriota bacterium]|nr:hypothetical protein [Acidobacteriota bacterium]